MKPAHKNVLVLLTIIGVLAVFVFLATFSHDIPRRNSPERHVDYSKCTDVSYGVYKGRACRGMTKQEVVGIIGLPGTVNRTVTQSVAYEQWAYGDKLLYFDNDLLISFQD
jgi:hypothetical protein